MRDAINKNIFCILCLQFFIKEYKIIHIGKKKNIKLIDVKLI